MGSTEAELAAETEALKTLLGFIGNTPALQQNGILTFASSAGAVYAGSKDDIITEDSAPAPLNAYGREKLKQEELLRAFSASHPGLRILIARMSNLYGAGQSRSKKQGLLSHIARCILLRKPINIFVPFDTIRDYIPADDAAALLLEICDRLGSGPFTVKIIASESPVTVAQIIGTFKYVTRVAPRVITSTGAIAKSYTHRMVFKSTAKPIVGHRKTSLLIGVSRVMADEKMKLMTV
jgi:UDP-glucose 4-epimerase